MSFQLPWGIQNICAGLEGVMQDPWENHTFVEGQDGCQILVNLKRHQISMFE